MSTTYKDSPNKKQRLGRGLGSLLGGASIDIASATIERPALIDSKSAVKLEPAQQVSTTKVDIESRIWKVPIEKIVPSAYQPRTNFDKEKLQELANSIKENGILQPIVVRKQHNGAFEIIAGERRWRAAQMAGMFEVPVILKTLSNAETLELAIIENIQREDLSPLEEAEAYQRLATEFNLTQQQISEKVGKDRATVANALRLLHLPTEIKEMLKQNALSAGHAKVLLGLIDTKQMIGFAKQCVSKQFSVRKLEQEVQKHKKNAANEESEQKSQDQDDVDKKISLAIKQTEDELRKTLGTKIQIEYKSGTGKISMNFYSKEEFGALIERLKSC